jgi:hypothetical protein
MQHILKFDQVTYRLRILLYHINILPILFILLLYSIYAIFVYENLSLCSLTT